ncbi:uncharacterized protein [Ptychodera flava]|uniref:uncharacterized protein n=1 Tax=Ptychodera flava TaxID=63121 RepID=UPI00396A36DB
MGSNHSKKKAVAAEYSRKDRHDDWVNFFVCPDDSFKFNARSSYAVCAGVSKQLYQKASELGTAADNDASMMYDTLTEYLDFSTDHVRLFTSETTPATGDVIKTALKIFASEVPSDGVLLFHFSGHCNTAKDQAVLVPADYIKTWESVITVSDLNEAFKDTKAKYVIMILDCCFAGKFALELLSRNTIEASMCVLASCSSREKSLSFAGLGNGFFTYFTNRYLRDKPSPGEFPVSPCIDYCWTVIEAITSLLRPSRKGVKTAMTPISAFKSMQVIDKEAKAGDGEDEVDAATAWRVPEYITELLDNDPMPGIPDSLCDWLLNIAEPALGDLKGQGTLSKDDALVYNTVLTFMTWSCVTILCDSESEVSKIEVLRRRNTFLLCYLLICETFYHVEKKKGLVPDLKHLETCLIHYIRTVSALKDVGLETDVFDDIVTFLITVRKTNRMLESPETFASAVGDEVDSGSSERDQALQTIQDLTGPSGIPMLPPIE